MLFRSNADVSWVEGGYLFIVPPDKMRALESHARLQQARGCVVDLLDAAQLKTQFPSINVADLGGGAHTPHDGWCDPHSLLWALRKKAESLGVRFIQDRVVGADVSATQVKALHLKSGARVHAAHVVNAAGAWAGEVAQFMGMHLPVAPLNVLSTTSPLVRRWSGCPM